MSDSIEDDLGLDEDDLEELRQEQDPDALTPEEAFTLVLLNKRNNTRVSVKLQDDDGDEVELAHMMDQLVSFIKDKLDEEEGNQIVDQIMPLMSQALVSGLGRLLGNRATAFFISNPNTRMALIYMMMVSFTLYKVVQTKGLKVITEIEDVSEEEIEEIERKSHASSVASMAALGGVDPREILSQMVEHGDLTQQDLRDLLGSEPDDDTDLS